MPKTRSTRSKLSESKEDRQPIHLHEPSSVYESAGQLAGNQQIVEVIFKTEICGREANDCAASSLEAVSLEKDGRFLDYEDDDGSSTSGRLLLY
jgi:hypothetical protein